MDRLHRFAKSFIDFYFPDFDIRVRQSRENSADYEKNIIRLNLRDDEDFGFMRHLHEVHGFKLSDTLISPMMWTIRRIILRLVWERLTLARSSR